jgi:rare lipoprotein A
MRRLWIALLLAGFTMSCASARTLPKDRARTPGLPLPSPPTCYSEQGIASWYGSEFHRKPTATGEVYDMYAMTAAHKTLPLGAWVLVTDLDSRRSVRVRINDRGPFVKDRIIDLSYGAAHELGIVEKGTAQVEVLCSFSEATLRDQLGYWVQTGAYQDPRLARDLAIRLKKDFPNVRVFSSDAFHHVRIGPFPSEPEANRVKDLLRRSGKKAFVVRDLLSLSAE